jgi:hypothetical protein
MEGRSLVPILKSASAPGRRAFVYEYFKDFPYRVPPIRGVRTEKHMYVEYAGRRKTELYDMQSDPQQKHNLMKTEEGERLSQELKGMLESLKRGQLL